MNWRTRGFNRGVLNHSFHVQAHISGSGYKACPLGWGVVGIVDSCLLVESPISFSPRLCQSPTLPHPRKCHLLI